MRRRHYRTTGLLIAVGVAVLLSGCSDPQSVELRSRRHESLSWTVETLAKTESQSPKSMAWALGTLHEQHERDLENSSKNPARVGAFIQNDFDRWKANQPAYNHAIQRELEGHPDNIGRTAPKLVW